jgi:tetratricopeptide (TPR) repeat protein
MEEQLHQFADSIRDQIAENDTSEAIETLQQFLEKDPKYKSLLVWLLSIRADLTRMEQQARRSLISQEDQNVARNRINDKLFQLLRNLEEGKLEFAEPATVDAPTSARKNRWVLPLIGILAVAAVAFFGWRFFNTGNQEEINPCPPFAPTSNFNVMLFPFRQVSGEDANPEISIQDRLDRLCLENGINSSIRIFNNYQEDLDFQTVEKQGNACQAELVIWGTVEQHAGIMDLTTRYKYLGEAEGLEVTKIQLEGATQVDTTTSISSIVRQGVLTKNIEDLILTLFGLIAHEEEQYEIVVEQLEGISPSDTSGTILTGVLLADAYLALKDNDNALLAYNQVLEVHPEYPLALNNRAAIQFLSGKFQEAANDYSQIIKIDPNNEDALAGRIAAYQMLKKDDEVEVDVERLRRINPNRVQKIRRFNN